MMKKAPSFADTLSAPQVTQLRVRESLRLPN